MHSAPKESWNKLQQLESSPDVLEGTRLELCSVCKKRSDESLRTGTKASELHCEEEQEAKPVAHEPEQIEDSVGHLPLETVLRVVEWLRRTKTCSAPQFVKFERPNSPQEQVPLKQTDLICSLPRVHSWP